MRILLIESDYPTAQGIEANLQAEGFSVVTTHLGAEGAACAKRQDHDLILLDPDLPDMSGREVLQRLCEDKIRTPVLVVSNAAGIADLARGFGFGADDYMTKPVHKTENRDELISCIQSVLRRSKDPTPSVVEAGPLRIDLDAETVEVGGQRIPFSGKREYRMLELLARRKGMTVTKPELLDLLYGGWEEPELKIVDRYMTIVRRKSAFGHPPGHFIRRVWGKGYSLRDPDPQ